MPLAAQAVLDVGIFGGAPRGAPHSEPPLPRFCHLTSSASVRALSAPTKNLIVPAFRRTSAADPPVQASLPGTVESKESEAPPVQAASGGEVKRSVQPLPMRIVLDLLQRDLLLVRNPRAIPKLDRAALSWSADMDLLSQDLLPFFSGVGVSAFCCVRIPLEPQSRPLTDAACV